MNKTEAIAEAIRILGAVVTPLTDTDWGAAAEQAALPDSAGRLPGATGWEPTFCPWWTAAEAVAVLQLRAQGADRVKEFTADGARFAKDPADLPGLIATLRSRSPIAQLAAQDAGFGVIDVQGGLGYDPTSTGLLL